MPDTQVTYPTVPDTEPPIGSLLTTATVEPGVGWLLDGNDALFESYNSVTFGTTTVLCGVQNKTFNKTSTWIKGFAVIGYGGMKCASGVDMARQLSETERVFDLGASVTVEAAVMDRVFSPTGPISATQPYAVPTDITPAAGAVKPKVGIAMLEAWMARGRYVGVPTLHLPTIIASLVMGLDGVAFDEKVLRTKLGSKVVNGAGYDEPNVGPTGTTNAVGERWIYATGEVLIREGRVEPRQGFNQYTNDVTTLAERAYVVAVDGPVVGVRVQVTA